MYNLIRALCAQNIIQIDLKTVFKHPIQKYLKCGQYLRSSNIFQIVYLNSVCNFVGGPVSKYILDTTQNSVKVPYLKVFN